MYAWNQLGRKVKKGERGIRILAPIVGITRKKDEEAEKNITKHVATSNRYKAFIFLCYREGIHDSKVTSNPTRQVRHKREGDGRLRFLTRKEYDSLCGIISERFPGHIASSLSLSTPG
jgi:hypothetical protein